VVVSNVRFTRDADAAGGTAAANPLMGFDKNDIMRTVELLILGVVAALIIVFVARPMLKRSSGAQGAAAGALPRGETPPALPAPTASSVYEAMGAPLALPGPDVDATIDIARIEGAVKASSVKKVSEFVEKHPQESLSTLRNWLNEPASATAA
jgi:flagellar M-ring protein FliF